MCFFCTVTWAVWKESPRTYSWLLSVVVSWGFLTCYSPLCDPAAAEVIWLWNRRQEEKSIVCIASSFLQMKQHVLALFLPVCRRVENEGEPGVQTSRRGTAPPRQHGLLPHQLPRQPHGGVVPQKHYLSREVLQHPHWAEALYHWSWSRARWSLTFKLYQFYPH